MRPRMGMVVACCLAIAVAAGCAGTGGGSGAANSAAVGAVSGAAGNGGAGGTAAVAGAAANGGGGKAAPSSPCSLLTQAEVSGAVGEAVGPGDNSSDPNECIWMHTGTSGVPNLQVLLTIERGTSFARQCDTGSSAALGIQIVPLSGVGDGACFVVTNGFGTDLIFEKTGLVFEMAVEMGLDASVDKIEAAEKALAVNALARL